MKSRGLKLSLPIALSVVLLLLLIVPVFAQPAQTAGATAPQPPLAVNAANNYVFSYTTTSYTEITGTTSTATGDDGTELLTLPFTFRYDGVNYTQGRISTNGYFQLGTGTTSSPWTNDLASTTNKPFLAALWDDLYDDTTSVISYTTQGSAPDRILVIQWKGIRWYGSTGTAQNFQIKLYETSNVIEFVYGTMSAPAGSPGASIGINDATGGSGHFLSVTPANPPTVSSTTANNSIAAVTFLPSGTVYRFTPPPPAPDFSASTKSVSPSGTRFTGEVLTYTVAIVNSGDLTGTITTLSDPIPAGVSFIDGSAQVQGGGTLTATASSIDWSGEVAPSGRVTVTFQVTLTAQMGSVTNTATISDALISAAVVKSVNTVVAAPNYNTSTKVVSPQVHVGQRATYTVTLINTGLATGSTTTLIDPIPTGTTYVDNSAVAQGGGTLVADTTGITWTGSIAPSQRVTVTYQVTLTASSGLITNTATITDPLLTAAVVKTASTALQSPVGGPDGGGYTYTDSYAPGGPTFTWVPTTGAASLMTITSGTSDDGYGIVPLGFDFHFYTGTYTQAFVATNGFARFGAGSSELTNAAIPNAASPNNVVACFWDDQEIQGGPQGIWYETFSVAPNRYAVITYLLQDYASGTTVNASYTYQMILYEGTNQILCQYSTMTDIADGDGKSATVGLENASGTIGLQYSSDKNPGPIEENLAILFNPGAGYTSSTKTVQPTGSVTPGQVLTYTVVVANGGALTGTATMNDPIPAGTTYVPGSAALVGTGTLTATGSAIDWSGSLASGDHVTTTFQVTVTATTGVITNTAVISDPLLVASIVRTASNSIVCTLPTELSFTYDPQAPLTNQSIDFTGVVTSGTPPFVYTWDFDDGSPIEAGNPISHSYAITGMFNVTMTVTNVCGGNSTSQAVIVSDAATPPTLDALQSSSPTALGDVTYFTSTLLAGSTPITYTWDFGDGTNVEDGLTINHTYTQTGQYEVSLTADNIAGTATVTTSVRVLQSDLGILKTASPDPLGVGELVTYQITVTNHGPEATDSATVVDTLPASFQFASASTGCANVAGTVTCAIGVLSNGQSASISIVVTTTALGTYTNTATVSGPSPDPVPGNNTATAVTTVASPEIGVSPTALDATQTTNVVTTQTLTINNNGPINLNWSIQESTAARSTEKIGVADFAPSSAIEQNAQMRGQLLPGESANAVVQPYAPAATLVSEGFEAGVMPPTGWLTRTFSTTTRKWTLVDSATYPTFVHSGSYAAWVNYDSSLSSNEWLLTPAFTVGSGQPAGVSFWARTDTVYPGATMTLYAIDASGTFTDTLWDLIANETWPTASYRQVTRSLDAYQGKTIRLAWQYHGLDGESFGLDDVLITGSNQVCSANALPWVSTSPSSGSTAAGGSATIDVQFDSTGLTTGVYTGTLCVLSNDVVNPLKTVPVTMTVILPQANLAINVVGSGDVIRIPAPPYAIGEVVTLTAVPDTGWSFASWSGDLTGTTNPITITLTGNNVVTATFTALCEPVAGVDFTYTPMDPKVGQLVTFNGTATTGTAPITYTWNFGDSSAPGSGSPIAHLFPLSPSAQSYTVTLTAENACGSTPVAKVLQIQPLTVFLPLIMR